MTEVVDTFYLYKITNTVNGKLYIGVTKDYNLRFRQHMTKLSTKNLLSKAVKKYGRDKFKCEVICIGSKEYICSLEQKAIELYRSNIIYGTGYNVAEGGYGGSTPRRGKVAKRKDDTPVYVSGFWFPNKRTALDSLKWTNSKFRYRKSLGILGNVFIENLNSSSRGNAITTIPIYYRGFWFPGVNIACDVYKMTAETIKKDILNRRFEESDKIQSFRIIRKFKVHGNPYSSLKEAAEDLCIPHTTIKGRYDRKSDPENYSYTYVIEEIQ